MNDECDCEECQMALLARVPLEEVECTCEDPFATAFEGNPEGHYVGCPCWGTTIPIPDRVWLGAR